LEGNELTNSGFKVHFRQDVDREDVCDLTLTKASAKSFENAVDNQYWFELFLDDLPMWGMVGETLRDDTHGRMEKHIFTHRSLSITYNDNRIIAVNLTSENPMPIDGDHNQLLQFTYSVKWKPTTTKFEDRFSRYLEYDFFEHKIHWFVPVHSFIIYISINRTVTSRRLCGRLRFRVLLHSDFQRFPTVLRSLSNRSPTVLLSLYIGSIVLLSLRNRFAITLQSSCCLFAIASQSLRNRFAITLLVLPSLRHRFTIALRSLFDRLQSLCCHFTMALQSFCCRFAIALLSLCNRLAVSSQSLRNRFAIASQSLNNRIAIALLSLCNRFAVASQLLCYRFAIASQSFCYRFAIDSPSLRHRFTIALLFALQWLCYRFATALLSLCYRFAIA
jgi:hypothetical protein